MTTTLAPTTTTRLSGFKPTGRLHLGNFLGAIRPMADGASRAQTDVDSGRTDSIIMIANLHAMTVEHDPVRLRDLTDEMFATMLACGIDQDSTTIYVQSDVPEHAELHYLLECVTGYGEAARMIQFRQMVSGPEPVRLSLLTYPVLMAADILLLGAAEVPVGDDQMQHLELARDVANRFNTRYGNTFTVPRGVRPQVAARVMDLADPSGKMGKSSVVDSGQIFLLDPPDVVRRKVMRAVTDTERAIVYDPVRRPAVSNLVEILAACERADPAVTAARFTTYAHLKEALADAIANTVAPVQRRYAELVADRPYLERLRREGAQRVRERARQTVDRARRVIGLAS
jgi:tryptophanyl-tRNA synthetase